MLCRSPEKALNTADILKLLEGIASHRQEHFVVLSLDSGQRLIVQRVVFIGTVNSVLAHPREIFAGAIADLAATIIVAHNHPSGDPTPSKQDISMTQQLVAAGQILGVKLHDHIIVAGEEYFSFRMEGLLLRKSGTFGDDVLDM
jgi:DNA repair protein RadC